MKCILDFDNTMGIHGRDIDDGITWMFLEGRADVELLGVTTTFGNGTVEEVNRMTEEMKARIGVSTPVYYGSGKGAGYDSEAARWLADTVCKSPGEITLFAIGSMANVYGASLQNPKFFEDLGRLIFMGGITEPLQVGDRIMHELNLSTDPLASSKVLARAERVTAVTGNVCLQMPYGDHFLSMLQDHKEHPAISWILEKLSGWIHYEGGVYHTDHVYLWDALTALYALYPECFRLEERSIAPSAIELASGRLVPNPIGRNRRIDTIVEVREKERLQSILIEAWRNLSFTSDSPTPRS